MGQFIVSSPVTIQGDDERSEVRMYIVFLKHSYMGVEVCTSYSPSTAAHVW